MKARQTRNPGPSWGYAFIRWVDRWAPEPVFRFLLHLGTTLAVPLLPQKARASRRYLDAVLNRPATWRDVRKHFIAFADFLVLRFRVADGHPSRCFLDPGHPGDFVARASGSDPLLFGTFHLGHSDLLGFWLTDFDRSVRMIRHKVGNSGDLDWLHRRFAGRVEFIWVNHPTDIPFAIRDAIQGGHSVALKCDRSDFSSKTEKFNFLGEDRTFPVTIYHLALAFGVPALLAFGTADASGGTRVYSLPAFQPMPGERKANLRRARAHFQDTLNLVEELLRDNPYQWFNFGEFHSPRP
jgi:predicted LPLAT superfamily acyltransferase